MKVWKKNLVAAAILVTVCAGIYVNWLYTEDKTAASLENTLDTQKVMNEDSLVLSGDMEALSSGEDVASTATDYFAAVRLSRQQARDNAVNLLQEAMAYSGSESSKDVESAMELEEIVQTALSEAQIESLIIAKGYADCVAYMSGDGISVAVSSPEGGLQQADVAVIADIVMTQSDYSLDDIRVVELQQHADINPRRHCECLRGSLMILQYNPELPWQYKWGDSYFAQRFCRHTLQ